MNRTDTIVKMVMDRWEASIRNADTLINGLTDEALQREVAPGRNRGIYLLGHLIAVHDDMLVLLDMGSRRFPEWQEPFLKKADRETDNLPVAAQLRSAWTEQCRLLQEHFSKLAPEQWFEKHTAVAAEDFAKEPHRNKLNIIITRTTHLQYHLGQLQFLSASKREP
jgi:hypothetical protein